MNLRDIKKDIEYLVGEFIDDCSLFLAFNPDRNDEGIAKIIDEAVDLYNDLRDKVNCKVEATNVHISMAFVSNLLKVSTSFARNSARKSANKFSFITRKGLAYRSRPFFVLPGSLIVIPGSTGDVIRYPMNSGMTKGVVWGLFGKED